MLSCCASALGHESVVGSVNSQVYWGKIKPAWAKFCELPLSVRFRIWTRLCTRQLPRESSSQAAAQRLLPSLVAGPQTAACCRQHPSSPVGPHPGTNSPRLSPAQSLPHRQTFLLLKVSPELQARCPFRALLLS